MPNVALRTAGLVLLAIGVLAMRHLFQIVRNPPGHDATFAEMGFAAIGFLALSGGVTLAVLGLHILDRVEISAHWVRRS